MFNSVRARLTLWYTGVLALVLISFALAGYSFLSYTLNRRTDEALAEMAEAFAATLANEEADSRSGEADAAGSSADETVKEVVNQDQFRDYQIVVYTAAGRQVFRSAKPLKGNRPGWAPGASKSAEEVDAIARTAAGSNGRPFLATLSDGDNQFRVIARRVQARGSAYTLIMLRSLREQEDLLEGARYALFIAVPLSLLLASMGGYFLARKSLAPVVRMSASAARIGAANLHERLPIANARDELGGLAQVINALLARLDASFEQQRRFMADASHELRTPIAIMRSEAEVALSEPDTSTQELRESIAIFRDETKRLTGIVEDLFMLARADAGQYKLTPKEFYLDELAGEVVRAVRALAAERDLTLELDAAEEMPFRGDEKLLRRLLLNLVDNAIKYTPRGGGVTVAGRREGDRYIVNVSDTGPGIPVGARPHIFERFYRADSARSRVEDDGAGLTSGAGLGLSIARWIAEAHDGTVELLRSSETGSVFQLTLSSSTARALQSSQSTAESQRSSGLPWCE